MSHVCMSPQDETGHGLGLGRGGAACIMKYFSIVCHINQCDYQHT